MANLIEHVDGEAFPGDLAYGNQVGQELAGLQSVAVACLAL
jgi:hypothetical protein